MNDHIERPTFGKWMIQHVLPGLLIAGLGAYGIISLAIKFRPHPEAKEPPRVVPAVEVIDATPAAIRIEVESQGTVQPRTQSMLVAEISGRIESVSPALYAGGFFRQGDVLARIDPIDYEAALANARSRLAEAKLAYEQERAASAQAQEDWQSMGNQEAPGDLVLRKPQLERAKANVEAAEAAVAIATRDLERVAIKAPYDGRVREKFVDVGQMVNARASQIASIYSVDIAEIRLPISLNDLQYIDVPESYRDASSNGSKSQVTLETNYGGKTYRWNGELVRSEGTVDPQTRLLYVVAQVQDPYGKGDEADRPPLKAGSFVTASIHGRTIERAYQLPRRALRSNDTVYLIDDDNHLRIQPVTVHKRDPESIIVSEGLEAGDRVCLTPLQYAVDGMDVTIDGEEPPSTAPVESSVATAQ